MIVVGIIVILKQLTGRVVTLGLSIKSVILIEFV